VRGGSHLKSFSFDVPADISSAAFWMVAAAIVPSARITLRQVGVNPSRTGILDVFRQAGVQIRLENAGDELGEPVADLMVSAGDIRPFSISGALVPRLIDEIPVLAVLATQAEGVSTIRDARELRVKESDRIESVAKGLRAMGAEVETHEDGMSISGPNRLKGAMIEADGDHRIAMAFAIAGLIADGETAINGAETIASSYPNFERDLAHLSVL
ncbi:MAG: 3-phosphoshikimate 1-carboxyvinyltransferase, partial [Fimbriimonadaceae bacterium]